jgi:hypothetical protein
MLISPYSQRETDHVQAALRLGDNAQHGCADRRVDFSCGWHTQPSLARPIVTRDYAGRVIAGAPFAVFPLHGCRNPQPLSGNVAWADTSQPHMAAALALYHP